MPIVGRVIQIVGIIAFLMGLLWIGQGLGWIRWPSESWRTGTTRSGPRSSPSASRPRFSACRAGGTR